MTTVGENNNTNTNNKLAENNTIGGREGQGKVRKREFGECEDLENYYRHEEKNNCPTNANENTTNTNTFRRAFVTGAASIFTASAAFFQTSSSAFAKLPEFQYEDSELRTAASGMQYADVVVGTGASPQKGQTIQAHYTGRLTNGRTFDSSYERGSPLKFKVGVRQVIQGWDDGILGAEGVEGMKVGGKRVLIIPPELGYGARGAGGVIPGNATLKFDVELVAVL